MPLRWYSQRPLEVKSERERGRLGGINTFKINNCWLTQVYCQMNGRGQDDHRRWNPSEGNREEHRWNFYHRHSWSGLEDDGEAL